MGKLKGCVNEGCTSYTNKKKYKVSDNYCTNCGEQLVPVCKGCYTQMSLESDKYCVRCAAAHTDRSDKLIKFAGKAAVGGAVIVQGGKTIISLVRNIKA